MVRVSVRFKVRGRDRGMGSVRVGVMVSVRG